MSEPAAPPWSAVLPGHLAARVLRHAPAAQPGVRRELDAVVLDVDIDGFTAASERLADEGVTGTERVRDALNEAFGTMLATVDRHGGHVLQFRGDALTALFPTGSRGRTGAARRAAACALDLAGPQGPAAGGMSIGSSTRTVLAEGRVTSVVAGDPAHGLLVVTTGLPLRRCAEGAARAPHGAVVADRTLADVPGLRLGRAVGGGFRRVEGVAGVRARPARRAGVGGASVDASRAAAYLPAVVADRLAAGRRAHVDEHRPVTMLVVTGLPDRAAPGATMTAIAHTVGALGGRVLQADVDASGLRCLAVFGAPVGREDDAARAVACASELVAAHPGAGLGLATGTAFCGLVGGPVRLDYTVLGDVVNVAARLAARATPGIALLTDATAARAPGAGVYGPLRRLRVRGRQAPVASRRLRSAAATGGRSPVGPAPAGPLVGRGAELRRLRDALRAARAGRGRALVLSGPPGIGKSRLLGELVERAGARGFRICAGRAPAVPHDAPYRVLREPVLALLDLDPALAPAAALDRAEDGLRSIDERLVAQLPLLALLLDLPSTVAPPTDALEGEARAAALDALVGALVRAACRRSPVLVAIDDAHASDAASLPLLAALARDASGLPLLLALAARDDEGADPLAAEGAAARTVHLALRPLPDAAVERLIALRARQLWRRGSVPAALRERVRERAAGNPLYAEELLRDAGARAEGQAAPARSADAELPDRLQRLILARVDRLPERDRAALVAASVLGVDLTPPALAAVDPSLAGGAQAALDALGRLELTGADATGAHAFRQPAVREAVYDSLSRATRAALHEAAGAYLEAAVPASPVELIAHHYGASRRVDKQRAYWQLAAEAARRRYAHEAACAHYVRLLEIAPADERPGVQRALGEVLTVAGDWAAAERHLQEALAAADARGDRREAAAAELGLGAVSFFTQSFEDARVRLERARTALARAPDPELLGRTLQQLGITRFQLGDYDGARAAAEEHLEQARARRDRVGASAARETLGLVRWYGGDSAGALVELRRSLRDARAAGHLVGVVHASGDLAGVHASRGEYARSVELLATAFEVAERIGYRHALGVIAGNAGELCLGWGDVDGARRRYHQALGLAVELGDVAGVQASVAGLGGVAVATGRLRDGASLLARAAALAQALEQPYAEAAALLALADARRRQGRVAVALARAREAVAAAEAGGNDDVAAAADLLATVLSGARDAGARRRALLALDEQLAANPPDERRAALLDALWELDPGRPGVRRQAAAAYARLHRHAPLARYRERYLQLTERRLATPAFPVVPTGPEAERPLGSLLAQARAVERRAAVRPGDDPGGIPEAIEAVGA